MSVNSFFIEPEEGSPSNYLQYRDSVGRPVLNETTTTDPGKFADYETTYHSYAGTDISATVLLPGDEAPVTLGELHTVSYSTHRENTPVRYLGHTNPCGFVKGPRTIAGHLVFTQFNQYVWYKFERFKALAKNGLYSLADMMPPFDILLSFQNESGSFSKMKIFGVSIIDEGGAMSVDDLMIEVDYTFMARGIQPITAYVPEAFEVIKSWNTGGQNNVRHVGSLNDNLGIGSL